MTVSRNKVITNFDGKEEVEEIADERTGVPPEVRKWGEALVSGKREDKQVPEEALADLELVSFRCVLGSGGRFADGEI